MFQAVAVRVGPEHVQKSMTVHQVLLCWVLVVVHSSRRLSECLFFAKPSASRMWFVHWLLGLAFYVAMPVAVWIEGTGMVISKAVAAGLCCMLTVIGFLRCSSVPRADFGGNKDIQRSLSAHVSLSSIVLARIRSAA